MSAPAAAAASRVSFTVSVEGVGAGEALCVCLSTGSSFDPTKSWRLVLKETDVAGVADGSPVTTATQWHTPKSISCTRGAQFRYRYGVVAAASNTFLYWERLRGDTDAGLGAGRLLSTTDKSVLVEDVFGEMEDEVMQRRLDETTESFRLGNRAKVEAVSERLKRLFGPSRRLMIVTYSLPVVLRRVPRARPSDPGWAASWIEDDFLARTSNSIASDVETLWVGAVTRECFQDAAPSQPGDDGPAPLSPGGQQQQDGCSGGGGGGGWDAPPVLRPGADVPVGERLLVTTLTAGGLPVEEYAAAVEAAAAGSAPPLDVDATVVSVSPANDSAARELAARDLLAGAAAAGAAAAGAAAAGRETLPPIAVQEQGTSATQAAALSPSTLNAAPSPGAAGAGSAASGAPVPAPQPGGLSIFGSHLAVHLSARDVVDITRALNAMNAVPLFLPTALHEAYACYCASVLKPCMHNVLETGAQRVFPYAASLAYLTDGWRQYVAANALFARVLHAQCYRAGDVLWLNDYQLCMVPRELRALCAAAGQPRPAQAFYWHAPFPTSEIFRTLPVRDELLWAVLECDVVGFHAFNYARHFLQSAKRLLGVSFRSKLGGAIALDVDGRDVGVAISHVGVEAAALDRWMASGAAAAVARDLAQRYRGRVVIGGIDSCQRLSGVALKLLAFERLLEENPVYRRRVVLVQRCELRQALAADMAKTSAEVRERVAKIRATYGPDVIDYAEAPSFPPAYRVGLFHRADVFLTTSIREGLNLLPLEYVYVRTQWQMARAREHVLQDPAALHAAATGGEVAAAALLGGRPPRAPLPQPDTPSGAVSESGSRGSGGAASTASAAAFGAAFSPMPLAPLPQQHAAPRLHQLDAHQLLLQQRSSRALTHHHGGGEGAASAAPSLAFASNAAPSLEVASSLLSHAPASSSASSQLQLPPDSTPHIGVSIDLPSSGARGPGPGSSPEMVWPAATPVPAGAHVRVQPQQQQPPPSSQAFPFPPAPWRQRGGSAGDATPLLAVAAAAPAASAPAAAGTSAASSSSSSAADETYLGSVTAGMPAYYATLAAPPSARSRGTVGDLFFRRPALPLPPHPAAAGDAGAAAAAAAGPLSGAISPTSASAAAAATAAISGGGGTAAADAAPGRSRAVTAPVTDALLLRVRSGDGGDGPSVGPSPSPTATGFGAAGPASPFSHLNLSSSAGEDVRMPPTDGELLVAPLPPPSRGGCVMLSEFSAASHILNSNIVLNPWSISSVTRELDLALQLPDHERNRRQWRDYLYAVRNPAGSWSRQVISDTIETYLAREAAPALPVPSPPAAATAASPALDAAAAALPPLAPSATTALVAAAAPVKAGPAKLPVEELAAAFAASRRRLLVIDYGGTLMAKGRQAESWSASLGADGGATAAAAAAAAAGLGGGGGGSAPSAARAGALRSDFTIDGYSKPVPAPLLQALGDLSLDARNTVYVISGLRTVAIDSLKLSHLPHLGLAAENGMLLSQPAPLPPPPTVAVAAAAGAGAGGELAPTQHHHHVAASGHSAPRHAASFAPPRVWVPLLGSAAASAAAGNARHPLLPLPSAHDGDAAWAAAKSRALSLMHEYQWRVSGSTVREYQYLLAWDYRNADPEWAQAQAAFLAADLEAAAAAMHQHLHGGGHGRSSLGGGSSSSRRSEQLGGAGAGAGCGGGEAAVGTFDGSTEGGVTSPARGPGGGGHHIAGCPPPVRVFLRKTRVELAPRDMDKGRFVAELARGCGGSSGAPLDLLVVAGDDATDEDMFVAANAYGSCGSAASPQHQHHHHHHHSRASSSRALLAAVAAEAPLAPLRPCRVFTIRVGRPRDGQTTAAHFFVPDVAAMQALVRRLAEAGHGANSS